MKLYASVQVWDVSNPHNPTYLGWGTVVNIITIGDDNFPMVKLVNHRKIVYGDNFAFIPMEKAIEMAKRIAKDIEELGRKE